MVHVFSLTAAAVLVYMACAFAVAQRRGRNHIAALAWGPDFILAAAVSLVSGGVYSPRAFLDCGMVLIWGIRPAVHIHMGNCR